MTTTRNQIVDAVFNLIAASSTFAKTSKKFQFWDEIQPEDMPYMCLLERPETYESGTRAITIQKRILEIWVFIYVQTQNQDDPSSILNPMLDAIDAVVVPSSGGRTGLQTLGGLVSRVWIEGTILKAPGDKDGQGIARVPLKILWP